MMTVQKIHKFEKAGLGKAPFRVVGFEHKVGPIRTEMAGGVWMEVGSPGQPMGTCDYCGTGIANCYVIRSEDGNEFIVGSDCVAKTGDSALTAPVDAQVAKLRAAANEKKRKAKYEKDSERVEKAKAAFEANLATFDALPHPMGFTNRQTGQPLTMTDWIGWMLKNAGMSGRVRAARAIEGVLEAKP